MCVWCAYTGKRKAASLLVEWGRRIEGLWAGYYTGLVTQDEMGLHCAKTTGSQRFWDAQFQVEKYPGTAGLWHSRTNSGGDEHFAHPFVGTKGLVALVSQGSSGIYSSRAPIHTALMNSYLHMGMVFPSAVAPQGSTSNVLDDGKRIHCSDFTTQFVEWEYSRTGDPIQSIRSVFTQYREEASSIMLFKDFPGRIYFVTTSQRVLIAPYADGMALTLCTLAFGEERLQYTEVPVNSLGYVDADGTIHIEKLSPSYDNEIDTRLPIGCLPAARNYLREHGASYLAHLCDGALAPLFPKAPVSHCTAIAAYHTLEELFYNGEIELVPGENTNPTNGITGSFSLLKLRKE